MKLPRLKKGQLVKLQELAGRWERADHEERSKILRDLDPGLACLLPLLDLWTPDFKDLPLGFKCGDFELLERIGTGGFGAVYKARKIHIAEKIHAIKIINPARLNKATLAEISSEIYLLVLALAERSPYVLRIDDSQTVRLPTGLIAPFIVSEFVHGEALTRYCRRLDGPDYNARLVSRVALFLKICEGVASLHRAGIVHGDLKPENILVTHDGNPVIVDFGMAQRLIATQPLHALGGTLPYMAPELLTDRAGGFSPRADIYALGVLLFQILTDELPFADSFLVGATEHLATAIKAGRMPRLAGATTTLMPSTLKAAIKKGLAREPADRFELVTELGDVLEKWKGKTEKKLRLKEARQIVGEELRSAKGVATSLDRLLRRKGNARDRQLIFEAFLGGQIALDPEAGAPGRIVFLGQGAALKNLRDNVQTRELLSYVFPQPKGLPPPFLTTVFLGRLRDISNVSRKLRVGRRQCVVHGWPGVGKTTFLGALARQPELADAYPDGVLWTDLGQAVNPTDVLAKWGRALGKESILGEPGAAEMAAAIRGAIGSRKFLVIIDDVWKVEDAIPIKSAAGPNCGILLSTRLEKVVEALATTETEIYRLPCLKEQDSAALMNVCAPSVANQYPAEIAQLTKDLEHLPLALVVAARMLRTNARRGFNVLKVIDDIQQNAAILKQQAPPDRMENGQIPTVEALIEKTVKLLSEDARRAFVFLGVLRPKPAKFDRRAMQTMWMVEDPVPLLNELIDFGVIEPIGDGWYWMHAILSDYARKLMGLPPR